MLTLEWVSPDDLHEHWPVIREGLEKVAVAGAGWLIEDAYMLIKTNAANLHIGSLEGNYVGFIITQQVPTYAGLSVHIFATYSNANNFNLLHEAMPEIKEWAKNVGAKKLTFSSKRKGWEKQAEKLGFQQVMTFYENLLV